MKKLSITGTFESLRSLLSKSKKDSSTKSKTNKKTKTPVFKPSNNYIPLSNLNKEETIELLCLEEFNNCKKHYLSLQSGSCSKKELEKAKKDCQMAEEKHYKAKMSASHQP